MTKPLLFYALLALGGLAALPVRAQHPLDAYLRSFDYESRQQMKVSSEELVSLLLSDQAVLVDIRFEEEHRACSMDYAQKIPLNQLPDRLAELPTDRRIIAACPHKDRAIMAMLYLKSKGYETGYLKDGLLGLSEYLRGDNARHFIDQLPAAR